MKPARLTTPMRLSDAAVGRIARADPQPNICGTVRKFRPSIEDCTSSTIATCVPIHRFHSTTLLPCSVPSIRRSSALSPYSVEGDGPSDHCGQPLSPYSGGSQCSPLTSGASLSTTMVRALALHAARVTIHGNHELLVTIQA